MDELETLGTRGRIFGGRNYNRVIPIAILLVIAAAVAFGSFFTIDQGYRGVVLRLGAFARIAEPGLGFKVPFIDRVVRIRVQTNSKVYDRMEAYSRDQQLAELRLSVTYRIVPDMVHEVYAQFGSEDGMVLRLLDRRAVLFANAGDILNGPGDLGRVGGHLLRGGGVLLDHRADRIHRGRKAGRNGDAGAENQPDHRRQCRWSNLSHRTDSVHSESQPTLSRRHQPPVL